jgi:subtilisin family serine protease
MNWGLDRVDQSNLPLDNMYDAKYNGSGVKVFVIDSGYKATHPEFNESNRISCGADFRYKRSLPRCHDEDDGHGLMVSSMINGRTLGVAKGADVIMVRIGSEKKPATLSSALAGVDWVTIQKMRRYRFQPTITVMSFAFSLVEYASRLHVFDRAVNRMIAANVTTVVGAGNDYLDACLYSPARVPGAITVGATAENDTIADYSNHGPCVDVFAPGGKFMFQSTETHFPF